MSLPSSTLSRTLQSITMTKIGELEKQRKSYEARKIELLGTAEKANDRCERGRRLLEAVTELDPSSSSGLSLENITRWLDQSEYDASVPDTILQDIEKQLRSKLDVKTRRLNLADLNSRLLTEWLVSSTSDEADPAIPEITSAEDSFEIVERDRLQQLRDKFESVVFDPLETDEVEIDNYILGLFSGDNASEALERLRREVKDHGEAALRRQDAFEHDSLTWVIKGLLRNDLLSEDKKVILQDFLQDEIALGEICDVLNMKYTDLKNWSWDASEQGMPVEPRPQLNGKYRIMMDEDILQAILLHYIGATWSAKLKDILQSVIRYTKLWKQDRRISQEELDRRNYYLEGTSAHSETDRSVEKHRQDTYKADFFLSQLRDDGYDEDGEDEDDKTKKSPKEIKQQLLRLLATEIHVRRALDGEVVIVQSDLRWFATSISHSTIFAVLRFFGMPEEWISFFEKFLEAPLNMGPVSPETTSTPRVRIRRRGVPMAHALEKFLGELVLFVMDLAVNQEGEMLLYRFHDDLWLCGKPEKCAKAWKTMQDFAAVMGLEFNRQKTGSVYLTHDEESKDKSIVDILPVGQVNIGFLKVEPVSGDWVIDRQEVDEHIKQLQKQLSGCKSVLSWVQTWNSCIGRFFSHTFGEPANCFGRAHVDSILETHKRMQEVLFNGQDGIGKNVTEHLKGLIAAKFNVCGVPDAFIFVPEQLGGLGLRNPFVPLFLVRDQLYEDPKESIRKFLKDEKRLYQDIKREFEELGEHGRRRRYRKIYMVEAGSTGSALSCGDADTFMSFEEFTRRRESTSVRLLAVYENLMNIPAKKDIKMSVAVKDELKRLSYGDASLSRDKLDSETKWIIQFYSDELFETCGGLSLVNKSLLPLGILKMLKKRKVTWQMVL